MAMPNPQNRQLSTVQNNPGEIMDEVIAKGDLKQLSPEQRAAYYTNVCKSMGLNPFTKPFEYITLNNKLTLYATRTAADQLRKINGVSITGIEREIVDDLIVVTVRVQDSTGRTDEEVGAVNFGGLKGDAKANAIMKAITKAKRRATLSICGLGWLDETEVDSVPSARPAQVDIETGEIVDTPGRAVAKETGVMDQRESTRATAEVVDEPAQATFVDDDADRKKASAYAHATAEGLFGSKGHDVLHIMAMHAWGHDSLTKCTADQLRELGERLEAKADDEVAFNAWYDKWIAPYLVETDTEDAE